MSQESKLETLIKEIEKRLNQPVDVDVIVQEITDVFFAIVGLNFDQIEQDFNRDYKPGCGKSDCVYCKLRKKWLIRYLRLVKKYATPAKEETLALLRQANDVAIAVAKLNTDSTHPKHHHN